jgi:hypothetical protein
VGLEAPECDADIAGPRDPGDEADAVQHASTKNSRVDERTYRVSPLVLPNDTGPAGPGHTLGLDCAASGRPPSVTDHSSQSLQLGELSRSLRLAKSTTEGYPVWDDDVVRLSPYMRRHLSVHGTALSCCPTSPVPTARCGTLTPTTATVPPFASPTPAACASQVTYS